MPKNRKSAVAKPDITTRAPFEGRVAGLVVWLAETKASLALVGRRTRRIFSADSQADDVHRAIDAAVGAIQIVIERSVDRVTPFFLLDLDDA